MVELSTRKKKIRGDEGNNPENLGLREFRMQLNWPSPIRQVLVPIWLLISPIRGHINPIRQAVLLISHSCSYSPYLSHLHPPSLPFLSTSLPSSHECKVKSSLSLSPCYHHELTLSAAYTKYSIHLVLHTPKIVCRPFILTISSWLLNVPSAPGVTPYRSTATSQFSIRTSKGRSPRHILTVLS